MKKLLWVLLFAGIVTAAAVAWRRGCCQGGA